jgi:hypothetical protein
LEGRFQVTQEVFPDGAGRQTGVILLVGIFGKDPLAVNGGVAPPGLEKFPGEGQDPLLDLRVLEMKEVAGVVEGETLGFHRPA